MPKPQFVVDNNNALGGLIPLSLSHNGIEFRILFSRYKWLIIEFFQSVPTEDAAQPSGVQQLQGILRFDYIDSGDFKISIVMALYDMISRNLPEVDGTYHLSKNADGIKFDCRQLSYSVFHDLHLRPTSVSEEGWEFEFTTVQ